MVTEQRSNKGSIRGAAAGHRRRQRHVVHTDQLTGGIVDECDRSRDTNIDTGNHRHGTLLCAITSRTGWTFTAYYPSFRIIAYSIRADVPPVELGRAATSLTAELICRAFATRSQVNFVRLANPIRYLATAMWIPRIRKLPPRPPSLETIIWWLAADGIKPTVVPFAYAPDDIGFIIIGEAMFSDGPRLCGVPAYGPAKRAYSTALLWLTIHARREHILAEDPIYPPIRKKA